MTPHQPAKSLNNRSYIGLILSQFLAAFNDQATSIVAIFFAIDMLVKYVGVPWLNENWIIAIATACFITPFFLFSLLAGTLADKYSKRNILVSWKMAEVGMMGMVLAGFLLPHCASWGILSPKALACVSAALVFGGVFCMGTHSAFFVPAKYGAMPEILHSSLLSRGNGLLEGTSFTANILGTTFGGILYSQVKSRITDANELIPGNEWIIGAVLLTFAIVGAAASLLIERLPPAAPDRPFEWLPLRNFAMIRQSRSLIVAVVGIAFFAFMTLFMRQVLLEQGEVNKELITQKFRFQKERHETLSEEANTEYQEANNKKDGAQQAELDVALLIGLVGLGVGIGCASAGQLSGKKLELGLVLIGAAFLVVTTASLAIAVHSPWAKRVCLVMIGFAAGLYIVPMYTLLQDRAPKGSKGNLVATSNFLNVAGGLIAVVVFLVLAKFMQGLFGLNLTPHDVHLDHSLRESFINQLERNALIPRIQFFGASLITLAMILLLVWQRPDFLVRTAYWLRTYGRAQANADGLHQVPEFGPVLLVANGARTDDCLQLLTMTDRFSRFLVLPKNGTAPPDDPRLGMVRGLARKWRLVLLPNDKEETAGLRQLLELAVKTLHEGHVFAVSVPGGADHQEAWRFLKELQGRQPSPVCPVYCHHGANGTDTVRGPLQIVRTGEVLTAGASESSIQAAWETLAKSVD
ncbi:MAG TPA: MFS transporter [Pirellulales bacterium]|jgi:acyl-[acyl-carrier-protein]-phospholipid O-acyltransferase/long-chain-fatty-acid--[acyl-carrier-protein] ligase|nr:MFS transporter [Pirellulales bacterium]